MSWKGEPDIYNIYKINATAGNGTVLKVTIRNSSASTVNIYPPFCKEYKQKTK